MKPFISLIFALLAITSHKTAAKSPEIITILTDDDYPPYTYVEHGATKGIYVSLVRKAAIYLLPDYKVQVIAVPWKRALKLIETGEEFAVLPPYIHKESRPYISHYSEPLAIEQVVTYCQSGVNLKKAFTIKQPTPLTLGINSGYLILNEKYKAAVEAGKIKLFENKSTEANIQKLLMGRIDCYVNDRATIEVGLKYALSEVNTKYAFEFKDKLSSNSAHIGYSSAHINKNPDKLLFIERMDAAIRAIANSND